MGEDQSFPAVAHEDLIELKRLCRTMRPGNGGVGAAGVNAKILGAPPPELFGTVSLQQLV